MARVPEHSSQDLLMYNLNNNKQKLEDLQIKQSTLKGLIRPSDAPLDSVEILSLRSQLKDTGQFLRHTSYAGTLLKATDRALEGLVSLILKAKELAIAQASDLSSPLARMSVASEVRQLYHHMVALANTSIGPKYLFAGQKNLEKPFDEGGRYFGDTHHVKLEIGKGFFIPLNLHGPEVFSSDGGDLSEGEALSNTHNLFGQFHALMVALEADDTRGIQELLGPLESSFNRLISLRTHIGSLINIIDSSRQNLESLEVDFKVRRSHLEDADVLQLFSDLKKRQQVLKASYRAGQRALEQGLFEFLA